LVGDGIIKTGCVIQQEWSELRKKYGMENTFPRGQTTPFVSFTKTFLLTIIPSVKRKKRRYRKFERLNVRRLCNSNRYGKDKTVVIAMGRGKRTSLQPLGLNAGQEGKHSTAGLRKERDVENRRERLCSSVFVERVRRPQNHSVPRTPDCKH
jgi:hypothetical protein